jgi:hypothetical protein
MLPSRYAARPLACRIWRILSRKIREQAFRVANFIAQEAIRFSPPKARCREALVHHLLRNVHNNLDLSISGSEGLMGNLVSNG